MQHLGCGFNGFGQLLPRVKKRRILYFARLFSDLEKDGKSTLNVENIDEEFTSFTLPKLEKFTVSWSNLYIQSDSKIWLQGFNNGKRANLKTLDSSSNDAQSSIRNIEASGEMLFCTRIDGKCSVLNTRTCQELWVKGIEQTSVSCVVAGDMNVVALTDLSAGIISHENETYICRPFACAVRFSQVSCGKEHVLLLSQFHQVYSFGLGSRGQLGHGTTDREAEPRLLEALEMVAMTTISAGGWHSAAVSTIGDLYIWGWNEAGQLGFSTEKHSPNSTKAHHERKAKTGQKRSLQAGKEHESTTKKSHIDESLETSNTSTETFPTSCIVSDNQETLCPKSEKLPQTDQTIEAASTSIRQNQATINNDCNKQEDVTCEILEDYSELLGVQSCDSDFASDLGTEKPKDVLFQALPRILDLDPQGKDVLKVSCGSRHTAAISEDGFLYTWGWGVYGQLGHGDTNSRDTPTLVESLHDVQRVKVTDVLCHAWNTLVTVVTSNN